MPATGSALRGGLSPAKGPSESKIYGVQKCYMVTDVTDNVPDIPDDVMNNFKIYIFMSTLQLSTYFTH